MSNERSPRPSRSMTMGISGMSRAPGFGGDLQLFGCASVRSVSCNLMVARDITIDGDPDEVWEALTDPELMAEWLGSEREAVLEEGERGGGRRVWGGGARRAARVLVVGGGRAGLARRASPRRRPGRHARHGHRGAGRAVRA